MTIRDEKGKEKPTAIPKTEEETGEGGQSGTIQFHDFLTPDHIQEGVIGEAMNDMRQALLGVAEVETGILNNIKNHLDQLLNTIYQQVREYQHTATMDAMVSDQPITTADPAIIQSLDSISNNLNDKNAAILTLQRELEGLGAGVFAESGVSRDMLQRQLDELNKRNTVLKKIHGELAKHPMITGEVPKGVTIRDIKIMLESLNEKIHQLNETNVELKTQIKQQKLQAKTQTMDNKPDNAPNTPPSKIGRR